MGQFIPLSVPNLKGNELKYVSEAIKTEWVSTGGDFINQFEKITAEYVKVKGAVACQSGTAGLHLSLIVSGVKENDGVIVPTLTFIAAVNPVRYIKAVPFFMDCDDTLCIDLDKVERFCREECTFKGRKLVHKETGTHIKAIVVVHVFGNMADMEKALNIADCYNLKIIEDATEALGSYVMEGSLAGRFAGTIGDIGVYSYNGNKIITTGGGGMVVSNDLETLEKVKYLSTQAKDDALHYVHNDVGYNYRMTNLQAAVGIAQMEQIEKFIEIKTKNYFEYLKNGIDLIRFRSDIRTNYWFYSYMSNSKEELIRKLNEKGVQSRPIWNLICDLPPYRGTYRYDIQKARKYWKCVVNIPCSTTLSKSQVKFVSDTIKCFENV